MLLATPSLAGQHLRWFSSDMTSHNGAEYHSIARSLFFNQAFADPFLRGTGPTSWMPPVIPYVMGVVLTLGGGDSADLRLMWNVLRFVAVLGVLVPVFVTATRASPQRHRRALIVALLVAIASLLCNTFHVFQLTHDHLFGIPLVAFWWMVVTVPAASADDTHPGSRFARATFLGIASGLTMLTLPAIGLLACVSLILSQRRVAWTCVISVTWVVMVVGSWTARTHRALGIWAPVKSNASARHGGACFRKHPQDPAGKRRPSSGERLLDGKGRDPGAEYTRLFARYDIPLGVA